MSQTGTALVATNTKTLRDLMEKGKDQLVAALPKQFSVERFIRTCVTLYQTQPGMTECDPMSVLVSAMRAAELGLELSSPLGQAYLVPFFNSKRGCKEAQFQIGYRGLISLAYRSNRITLFTYRVRYEGEPFRYRYGTDQFIEHEPCPDGVEPGKPTHYYAVIHTTTGGRDFEVMTAAQVEQHRRRHSKQPNGFGWANNFDAMALKTVCRRLAKRVPMVAELCEVAAEDEMVESGMVPARPNPVTGEILEAFIVGPDDDGTGEPDIRPAESAPKKTRTDKVAERMGAGRESGQDG